VYRPAARCSYEHHRSPRSAGLCQISPEVCLSATRPGRVRVSSAYSGVSSSRWPRPAVTCRRSACRVHSDSAPDEAPLARPYRSISPTGTSQSRQSPEALPPARFKGVRRAILPGSQHLGPPGASPFGLEDPRSFGANRDGSDHSAISDEVTRSADREARKPKVDSTAASRDGQTLVGQAIGSRQSTPITRRPHDARSAAGTKRSVNMLPEDGRWQENG